MTADDAPLRNVVHAVERAYLTAVGPRAGALRQRACRDHRGGAPGGRALPRHGCRHNVGLPSSRRGICWRCDVVPIGGNHATFDLAQNLSAPVYEAERIKKDHVTLARAAGDDQQAIAYVLADEEAGAGARTTRGQVRAIVRDRTLRLFGEVAERLERSNVARYAKRIVLTGGASQQAGLGELAADFFARPVRVARMQPISGLPAGFAGPAFSTRRRSGPGRPRPQRGNALGAGWAGGDGLSAAYGTVAP